MYRVPLYHNNKSVVVLRRVVNTLFEIVNGYTRLYHKRSGVPRLYPNVNEKGTPGYMLRYGSK